MHIFVIALVVIIIVAILSVVLISGSDYLEDDKKKDETDDEETDNEETDTEEIEDLLNCNEFYYGNGLVGTCPELQEYNKLTKRCEHLSDNGCVAERRSLKTVDVIGDFACNETVRWRRDIKRPCQLLINCDNDNIVFATLESYCWERRGNEYVAIRCILVNGCRNFDSVHINYQISSDPQTADPETTNCTREYRTEPYVNANQPCLSLFRCQSDVQNGAVDILWCDKCINHRIDFTCGQCTQRRCAYLNNLCPMENVARKLERSLTRDFLLNIAKTVETCKTSKIEEINDLDTPLLMLD
ncbi:ORF119 [Agrotis segetum granulovirus]|uniref:ORF119 n=1 Tax=Agrotis segetum granulosis virus TaxID=10464 RepID=Q6QXH9_GVAS|nr:hypothetical protein AsGV135 [Agrotis segetum granulovirus]AAS82619.1 ORF119 [Agrotis segetum granulovirus]AHN92171.1 hypothetical protein AsGV132 [Agrotis segetum granulovirus]AKN63410.1 hypothetical protein AsGV135 [Agrotis segetum granulovirus]